VKEQIWRNKEKKSMLIYYNKNRNRKQKQKLEKKKKTKPKITKISTFPA
jgi:hypothetical protein